MMDQIDDEFFIQETDSRVLKHILESQVNALEFVNTSTNKVFDDNIQDVATEIMSYVKTYKAPPTERVLLEKFEGTSKYQKTKILFEEIRKVDISAFDFKYDLEKIKSRFKENKGLELRKALRSIDDYESIQNLTKKFNSDIQLVSEHKQVFLQKPIKDYIKDFKKAYNDKFHDKNLGKGIFTGYNFYDALTNGLFGADLLMIGGETGAGKSQLLNNMGLQIWLQGNDLHSRDSFYPGYNVLYFSLEMPYEMCFRRSISKLGLLPFSAVRDSTLNKEQFKELKNICEFIEAYPYQFEIIDIPRGATVEMLEERLQDSMSRYKVDAICVDYIGLLDDKSSQDDWLKLGTISSKLHELSRVYNLPVLTAAQLNRVAQGGSPVGLHRFGRSSLIGTNCSSILQIESRKDESSFQNMKIHVLKNRSGANGVEFYLNKNFACSSITDPPDQLLPDELVTSTSSLNADLDISKLLKEFNW